ncbi:hypothetical protein I6E68_09425 [Salinibacterium sp. NSLL150]|uniref:hypothetical protein n=1 Tax=unclassified Salinibacterium TaxID=2632331 RepID=UPI0018CEBE93|nr:MULTISPECIES: hypothetical protein [unclassified Salinibacterium]MBH0099359.1 hypothetical protein [Salinibacterium sp. NSLL35]MBH0102113.1 hypothetical protein [Salinibacterium sp. NSLL150]MBH0104873.1 hypothetical protein [Salinibacterium sp. NSLL16]MBH0107633.1 hypothetical protein [Salinibacterium sp. NSLL17]
MSFVRLATVAPDLVEEIFRRDDSELSALSNAVVAWAIGQVEIEDPRLAVALSALKERRVSDRVRDQLWELVQELDESAWDLQESEAGDETLVGYAHAFARARAANALWYSLFIPAASETVADCMYEAQAVAGDVNGLRNVVRQVLANTYPTL